MDFTQENNFFDDDELISAKRGGKPKGYEPDWDAIIDSGKWFFIPNSQRTPSAVKHNSSYKVPLHLQCEGYKFHQHKKRNPRTDEWGLGIKCSQYPEDV